MFVKAEISVQDQKAYDELHALLNAAFDDRDIEVFLNRVKRAGLPVRSFEEILSRGILGKQAASLYASLPVSDQALTRERYLQLIEAVPEGLRQRYLKVYAYY